MVDGEGGFLEGVLQLDDGKKAVVMVGHEVSITRHININFRIKNHLLNVTFSTN